MAQRKNNAYKLTDERLQIIKDAIALGQPNTEVSKLAGVNNWTFSEWIKRGEMAYADGDESSPYYRLYEIISFAQQTFIQNQLGRINEAAKKDWKAAAWLLERRFPEYFAVRQEIKANVEGVTIKNDLSPAEEGIEDGDIIKRIDC